MIFTLIPHQVRLTNIILHVRTKCIYVCISNFIECTKKYFNYKLYLNFYEYTNIALLKLPVKVSFHPLMKNMRHFFEKNTGPGMIKQTSAKPETVH